MSTHTRACALRYCLNAITTRYLTPSTSQEGVSIFASTALVLFLNPISFNDFGHEPMSDWTVWWNMGIMIVGEVSQIPRVPAPNTPWRSITFPISSKLIDRMDRLIDRFDLHSTSRISTHPFLLRRYVRTLL